MSGRAARWLGTGFACALLAAGEVAMAKTFNLSVDGDPDARFAGTCTTLVAGRSETLEIEGLPPLERQIEADELTCRFETTGLIEVEVTHDGSRSRSKTNGGVLNLRMR